MIDGRGELMGLPVDVRRNPMNLEFDANHAHARPECQALSDTASRLFSPAVRLQDCQ